MLFSSHNDNLGIHLLRRVFAAYVLIAISITALQLWDDYHQTRQEVEQMLINQQQIFESALENAIWHLDQTQIRSIAEGILTSSAISGISIHEPNGKWIYRRGELDQLQQFTASSDVLQDIYEGVNFSHSLLIHHFMLHDHMPGNAVNGREPPLLGSVNLYANPDIILQQVHHSFQIILLSALVKTVALWFLFLYFIRKIVSGPLETITQRAIELGPTKPLPPEAPPPIPTVPDEVKELRVLKQALNELATARVEERKRRQVLRNFNRELEQQVKERTAEIKTEHKRLNKAKDEFLAAMSHELRTPLTAIIGNCELLSEMEENQEKRQYIDTIETSGRVQLALVNDILDISKIESGKFTIHEAPYNLLEMMEDMKHIFSVRITAVRLTEYLKSFHQVYV